MENYIIILLCLAAFFAGFIDAVVGGGGLIQTPMGLILLPNLPVSTVVGSLKIPAFSGTSFAAYQYLKKVEMNWKLLSIMMLLAFPSAFLGSTLLTYVSNDFMKPILLVVLSFLVIYTYAKKNFGQQIEKNISQQRQLFNAVSISFIVGLYDGFIGPGTGSFLVVAFIAIIALIALSKIESKPILNPKIGEPVMQSLKEGVKFVFQNKTILGALSLDMIAVLFGGAVALLPIFAQDILKVGSEGFGILRAAPNHSHYIIQTLMIGYKNYGYFLWNKFRIFKLITRS